MLRKLGIITAVLAVTLGVAAPAQASAAKTRTTTVFDPTIGAIGSYVHFLSIGDAEAQDTHDGWTVVNASCTVHVFAVGTPTSYVDSFCHVFDATATRWYRLPNVYSGTDYGSANGQFVLPAGHVLKLCVDAYIYNGGGTLVSRSPCKALV